MSLISEALKRARLEAARREGEERGTVYASAPAYTPRRRRWPAAALAGAGLALGLAAGSGLYWALRPAPAAREAPRAESPVDAAPVLPPAPAAAPPPVTSAEPAPVPLAPPPIPAAPPRATAPPPPPALPPTAAPPEAKSAPPAAAPAAAAPLATPPVAGRLYSRGVDLPGGKRLELDGIVASPTDPLAMMNRRLMAPGEVIDGYTLVRIEPKRVELRGPDGATFFISLR